MTPSGSKFSAVELAQLQREQYVHDQRNHFDIICLPKPDRLKHYGLHFAKYVGRLARGDFDLIAVGRAELADPNWAAKVRDGRFAQLAPFSPEVLKTLA